jgi:hypothetical protein
VLCGVTSLSALLALHTTTNHYLAACRTWMKLIGSMLPPGNDTKYSLSLSLPHIYIYAQAHTHTLLVYIDHLLSNIHRVDVLTVSIVVILNSPYTTS